MEEIIREKINQIEQDNEVFVLYACESGSRAWGFASEDSDYDVRFIYLNTPEWYLSISDHRDVIEELGDILDCVGWDFQKALRLYKKSNPALMEWLGSPTVYIDRLGVADRLRDLMYKYYSQTACSYHYLHMAKGNFKDYLKADTVWAKKYFYVLRPILAVMWMEQGRGVVPTEFEKLLDGVDVDESIKREARKLVERKKSGSELDYEPRNHILSNFVEVKLDELQKRDHIYPNPGAPLEHLDELFIDTLREVF